MTRTIREIPVSAWKLLPPAPGACQTCGHQHEPEQPHNPQSLYWQTKRRIAGEPAPTWAEALEHVDQAQREQWIQILKNEHGIEVEQ